MEANKKHICAYCGKEYEASKPFSHIIPKQFFRRFKKGVDNKAVYSTYFQRVTQYEPVEFLLCHDCEEVFCKWESEFAKRVTNKFYNESPPKELDVNLNVKLAALSVLWRILHCWVVTSKSKQGSLNGIDIAYLSKYEKKWLDILHQQRDFQRNEANVFVIPLDYARGSNYAINYYKKYPGILADVMFYDQGKGKGYYCVRCLAHKIIIFAYLTSAFSIPRRFSIHSKTIELRTEIMPKPIEDIFVDYLEDAKKIKL